MEAQHSANGEYQLRRHANIGLIIMLVILLVGVFALKPGDGGPWFESREARIARLARDEMTTSLEMHYCGETGANCAALQAKLDVTRERLREVYR